MNDAFSVFDPVDELVDGFLERYRRGERPSLSEYTEKHPELAERIRALFPALLVMEELGSRAGGSGGSVENRSGPSAKVPERLGDYVLLRRIGSGGMGVVYEAIQESLGRHVALKTLPFHQLGDATRLERFRREARAAARLHHTHIVPVFGVGEHDGLHYYIMQFIRGQGLDSVLREVKRLRRDPGAAAAPDPLAGQALSTTLSWGLCTGRFQTNGLRDDGSTVPDHTESHHVLRTGRSSKPISVAWTGPPIGADYPDRGPVLSQRGPARWSGGRGPRVRPPAGHPPPRHQALQPPARRPGTNLGHRLRPGQGSGQRRADPHRRHRRHDPLHGAGAVPGEV